MLIPLSDIVKKYKLHVDGVLHVGAHYGEEADDYDKFGFNPVWWIEADGNSIDTLMANVSKREGHDVVHAVVSDKEQSVVFNRANNGQSSSILKFGTHSKEHPDVVFEESLTRTSMTIDSLNEMGIIGQANFVNLDIQGAELLALKGAIKYLSKVDYIYTEVNDKELYVGCCLTKDLDYWLGLRGFNRVEKVMTQHGWGDAFYIKG